MADQERTGPAASASLATDAKTNKTTPSQAPANVAHAADLAAEDDEVVEAVSYSATQATDHDLMLSTGR